MPNKIQLVAILGLCAVLTAGCSSVKKAETPKQAMANMRQAMLDGDGDAFAACFDADEKQTKMLKMSCEMFNAMHKFNEAMKKSYGDKAPKGMSSSMDELRDEKWEEKLEIKIDGEKATAKMAGKSDELDLLLKDGVWKISAKDMVPEKDDAAFDKELKQAEAMIQAYKDLTPKIGTEGYTVEKVMKELSEAMMKSRGR